MSVLVERTPLVPRPDGVLVEVKRTSDGMSALLGTGTGLDKLHRVSNLLTLYKNGERLKQHTQALATLG